MKATLMIKNYQTKLFYTLFFLAISSLATGQSVCGKISKDTKVTTDISCKSTTEVNSCTLDIYGKFTSTGGILLNKGELVIHEGGIVDLNASGLELKGSNCKVTIEPGGVLLLKNYKENSKRGSFVNDGYVELISGGKTEIKRTSINGDGAFYIPEKVSFNNSGSLSIMGTKSSRIDKGTTQLGNTTISAKIIYKLVLPSSGYTLGADLVVKEILNLNGNTLDVSGNKLKTDATAQIIRKGSAITEYIKTSPTSLYEVVVDSNNAKTTAHIGRNPYLPVVFNCQDCAGTAFDLMVEQHVFENPENQSVEQLFNNVDETWSITPQSSFSGNIDITLQWNDGSVNTTGSELSGFDRNDLQVIYWFAGDNSWSLTGFQIAQAGTESESWKTTVTIPGMKQGVTVYMAIVGRNSPLPVELSSFTATPTDNGTNDIRWTTETELNCYKFYLEHSMDASNWETIAERDCEFNSILTKNYDYQHVVNGKAGTHFYRLQQVDANGDVYVSEIVKTNNSAFSPKILCYPNPNRGLFTLHLPSDYWCISTRLLLEVYDIQGSLRYQNYVEVDRMIDLRNVLAAGSYVLRLPQTDIAPIRVLITP